MTFFLDQRQDPVLGYNFTISLMESSSPASSVTTLTLNTLSDNIDGGFNECSGLDASLEVEEFRPGGVNDRVLKFPTGLSWGKLVLKTGMAKDRSLWEWIAGFAEGKVMRRDGLITLLDAKREEHTVWKFHRGLPVRYTGPKLAAQESAVAFETIEIEHEGLELLSGASLLTTAIRAGAEGVRKVGNEVRDLANRAVENLS